jgi:hypothetical protein
MDFWLIATPRRAKLSQTSPAPAPAATPPAEKVVRDIRRATRKHHSAEDKIRFGRPAAGSSRPTFTQK